MRLSQRTLFLLSAFLLLLGAVSPLQSYAQINQKSENDPVVNSEPNPVQTESIPFNEDLNTQALIDRERYQQIIIEIENNSSQNAYSNELSEAYLNLASINYSLGDFDKAGETFDQALQIIRISTGLNSLQQLPVLQSLLKISEIKNDWQAVDSNAHLIFHINRQNFQPGDSKRVEALIQLSNWKLKAAAEDLLGGFKDKTLEAADLYSNEIELLKSRVDHEEKNLSLATLYLGEARSNIALAANILEKPLGDYSTGQPRTITTQRCRTVRMPNGAVRQICQTVEVPNMQAYIEPSNRKNMEISMTLSSIRKAIANTFDVLQKEKPGEQLDQLFIELHETAEAYNTFVTNNLL